MGGREGGMDGTGWDETRWYEIGQDGMGWDGWKL